MPRLMFSFIFLSALALPLGSCGQNETPWTSIPSSPDAAYTVSVKTFPDNYADHPFHVRVKSKASPARESTLLYVEQCKNVFVLPRREYIFIFYDQITLDGYTNYPLDKSFPRPFLCDLDHYFCREQFNIAIAKKEPATPVCSQN